MGFVSGFIIIDKPSGATSFSMVSLVRRLTGVRRVGHAGTLDPLASGVLPVALGQATRFIEYLDERRKAYVAQVRFGEATDTYDAEGTITERGEPAGIDAGRIQAVLPEFTGDIQQTPPVFSAIKLKGQPLYRYARAGVDVEVPSRLVHIERATLRWFKDGVAEIEVECGKGTFIRSLAHDLGRRLGCPAHLAALRRTSSGGFVIDEAHSPDELRELTDAGRLDDVVLAVDRGLERLPAAILAGEHSLDIASGRDVQLAPRPGTDLCRAYSIEGAFLGMLRSLTAGVWHPEKSSAGRNAGRTGLICRIRPDSARIRARFA